MPLATDSRTRYAVVGLGARARVFIDALVGSHAEIATLVGFCDLSPTRMAWHNRRLHEKFGTAEIPTCAPADFEAMIERQGVNTVIVTTHDALHHEYVVRAMNAGCDVIVEKPLTIDAEKAFAIVEAVNRTGRSLRVTFNYRYQPLMTKVRELVLQGAIGQPTAVNFNWSLDTRHGADYYRRWHRDKANSGGLVIHKASHHFDLVNWLVQSTPRRVFAMGGVKFYGREAAEGRGEHYDYERYTGEAAAAGDLFAFRLDESDYTRELYLEAEADSGYIRDKNVFGAGVTTEDTLSLTSEYHNGVVLNYSLIAYSPKEGYTLTLSGTRGRIDIVSSHGSHLIIGQSDAELAAEQSRGGADEIGESIRVYPMFDRPYDVEVPHAEGGHGGGDPIMMDHLFSGRPIDDPFGRCATHRDGLAAILMGIAANESLRTGLPVETGSLLPL